MHLVRALATFICLLTVAVAMPHYLVNPRPTNATMVSTVVTVPTTGSAITSVPTAESAVTSVRRIPIRPMWTWGANMIYLHHKYNTTPPADLVKAVRRRRRAWYARHAQRDQATEYGISRRHEPTTGSAISSVPSFPPRILLPILEEMLYYHYKYDSTPPAYLVDEARRARCALFTRRRRKAAARRARLAQTEDAAESGVVRRGTPTNSTARLLAPSISLDSGGVSTWAPEAFDEMVKGEEHATSNTTTKNAAEDQPIRAEIEDTATQAIARREITTTNTAVVSVLPTSLDLAPSETPPAALIRMARRLGWGKQSRLVAEVVATRGRFTETEAREALGGAHRDPAAVKFLKACDKIFPEESPHRDPWDLTLCEAKIRGDFTNKFVDYEEMALRGFGSPTESRFWDIGRRPSSSDVWEGAALGNRNPTNKGTCV